VCWTDVVTGFGGSVIGGRLGEVVPVGAGVVGVLGAVGVVGAACAPGAVLVGPLLVGVVV
jgi:hypothetical protein